MIIAIPTDEKEMKSEVCFSFGRAPYFLFYNTDDNTAEFFDNSAIAEEGGAGIKAAQMIVDKKTDVLITQRCGQNAADVLLPAGVKIYKYINADAKANIESYFENKLEPLSKFGKSMHMGG